MFAPVSFVFIDMAAWCYDHFQLGNKMINQTSPGTLLTWAIMEKSDHAGLPERQHLLWVSITNELVVMY